MAEIPNLPSKNGGAAPRPGAAVPMPPAAAAQQKPASALQTPALEKTTHSRFYRALSTIMYLFLLGIFGVVSLLFLFALDFLDVFQFRYKLPLQYRQSWPLSTYFDFVALHQMPDEERYRELMRRRKQEFDDLMIKGGSNIEKRSHELEESFRALVRVQEEAYKNRQHELDGVQEELLKQKKLNEDLKQDLAARKAGIDMLSRQIASEAASLESSLIRFMEEENKLRPVQEIAAAMDPKSIAAILDEVSDNVLIYNLLKGVQADKSALILSFMDPEKAGKILKISKAPPTLPEPGPSRSYIPPGLQDLLASSQANLR